MDFVVRIALLGRLIADVAHITMFFAEPELKGKGHHQTHMHMCAVLCM